MSHCQILPCTVVWLLLPCTVAADTRVIRHEGPCDLTKHDTIQNALQAALPAARMSYVANIRCGPFPGAGWAIVAPLSIANPTGQTLNCHCYLAFFDAQKRLVGCCNQGTDVDPGAKNFQLGSCIIHGPKTKLLTATHFQVVVYESDGPVGAEPVSAQDAAGLPGKEHKVVAKLVQTTNDVVKKDDFTELRLSAACSFHEPAKGLRNTHLQLKHTAEYDIYLSAAASERIVTRPGKEALKLPPLWSLTAEIERRQAPKNLASWYHVVLLDAKGKLVVCSAFARMFQMDAPHDRLLAARVLEVVVYETPLTPRK